MRKYIVEYMDNGNKYDVKTFVDFTEATSFYNKVRRREWARMYSK